MIVAPFAASGIFVVSCRRRKVQYLNKLSVRIPMVILVKVRMVVVSCCHGRAAATPFYLVAVITFVEEGPMLSR